MKWILPVLAFEALLLKEAQAQPTLFADGGYQTGFPACITSWRYKEKLEDGTNLETELNGCVSIEDFPPYPYYNNDVDEIAKLNEPRDQATDKTKWCPVIRDVYNPTPLRTESNRLNWGYCLDISTEPPTSPPVETTEPPTSPPTNPPTEEVTTAPPTEEPTDTVTTPPPTEETTTSPPTEEVTTAPPTEETTTEPLPTDPPGQEEPSSQKENNEILLGGTWTFVGIGVAAALVVFALVLAIFVARKTRNPVEEIIEEDSDDDEEPDLEENSNMTRT